MITKLTKYKQTGIRWMPEIPEHWEIGRVKNSFNFSKEIAGEEYNKYNVLSLSVNGVIVRDMESGKGKHSLSMDLYQVVHPRSIILCLFDMDVTPRIVGLCNNLGIITNAYTTVFPKENVDEKFYYYFFLQQDYNKSLKAQGTGVRTTLTNTQFGAVKIPIPPLSEQIMIAKHLDKKTEEINHFISQKQKFITLLKEQRQSIINEAVTKGIDKSVKIKYSGIDWLGEIPKHWEVRKLKYCVTLNQNTCNDSDDELKKIALENIDNWTGRFVQTETPDFEGQGNYFKKGDVLFNKLRPYLAKAYVANDNGICVGELLVLTPNIIFYTSEFLFQRLMTSDFIDLINSSTYGSKMPRANWQFIGNIKLSIPPISEQTQIIQHIKSETQKIDRTISQAEKEIELIKEYKEAMIAEAVMGKVNIKEAKAAQSIITKKEANWEFKEAVLISILTDKFGSEQYPLGRKRYTKYSYLFHRHTDNKTEGYMKKAAGPYNPKTKYGGPEKIALQNKYVSEVQNGNLSGFVASDKIEDAKNYFGNYWNTESLNWLEQLRYKKNDELELYATVDKAMVELAESNKDINVLFVKQLIDEHPQWKPKLERDIFSDDNIAKAMEFLKQLFQ